MKVCNSCGTTLNDDEDFCIICERYQNAETNNIPQPEYISKAEDVKEKPILSRRVKKFVIIAAIILTVVLIVTIVRESNKGTPDEILEKYMTAVCEGDAKEMVECVAVSGAEKQNLYTGAALGMLISEELFSTGESTYVVQDMKSLSYKEAKAFWRSHTGDNVYATDSEVGSMAKATVVQTISSGTYTNTLNYEIYLGVYKGKWKVIVCDLIT